MNKQEWFDGLSGDSRREICRPHTIDAFDSRWAVNTDGHGIIFIKDGSVSAPDATAATQDKHKQVLGLWADGVLVNFTPIREFIGCKPEAPDCDACLNTGWIDCEKCEGNGEIECVCSECEDEHTYDCRRCSGKGGSPCKCGRKRSNGEETEPGVIMGLTFNKRLLRKFTAMVDAKQVRVGINQNKTVLCLESDDSSWRLILMALNQEVYPATQFPRLDIAA